MTTQIKTNTPTNGINRKLHLKSFNNISTIVKNIIIVVVVVVLQYTPLSHHYCNLATAFAIPTPSSKVSDSSSLIDKSKVKFDNSDQYFCNSILLTKTNSKSETALQQSSRSDLSTSASISNYENNDNNNNNNMASSTITKPVLWFQHTISITAPSRGCHLITKDIMKVAGNDINKISIGMCNIFIQHTSASLTINENADPDVRRDMEMALNKIVPESWNYDKTFVHTMEGDDDMPGHVKSSLMGVSLNIPISNGKLGLGTWQGIYLNEHRNQGGYGNGHTRSILITINGQSK
jgi:secondary thiamine-phosphate synthase enzyme